MQFFEPKTTQDPKTTQKKVLHLATVVNCQPGLDPKHRSSPPPLNNHRGLDNRNWDRQACRHVLHPSAGIHRSSSTFKIADTAL